MGVNGLWKLLKAEGLVTNCGGEELAKHVEDKTIAIDISTWLLQAVEMKAYQHDKIHIRVSRASKRCLSLSLHWGILLVSSLLPHTCI